MDEPIVWDEAGLSDLDTFEAGVAELTAIAEEQAAKDRELMAALAARPKFKPNRKMRRQKDPEKRTVEVTLRAFMRWQKAGSPDATIVPKSKRRRRKGQGLVEYALILGVMAALAIGGLMFLSHGIGGILSSIGTDIAGNGNLVEGAPCDKLPNGKGTWHLLPNGTWVCDAGKGPK